MKKPNLKKVALLAMLVLSVNGCALWSKNNALPDQKTNTVATDFIAALALLRGHSPRNTTVQVRPPKTAFGQSLVAELRRVGYGLQTIPENDTGPMLVTYEADSYENSDHQSVAYRVRVGSVELGREYELRNGYVFPLTSLTVKGVQIASQPLDQKIFERNLIKGSSNQKRVVVVENSDQIDLLQPINDTTLIPGQYSDQWQSIESNSSLPLESQAPVTVLPATPRLTNNANANMLILGESNHADIFKAYRDLKRDVLVFPNDSLRMGAEVKERTRELIAGYNEKTDLVSIVGCSHGPTGYNGGNKTLALDRAKRVMEELVMIGVRQNNIYDEGCWAAVEQKTLPARGVIVTLKRRTAES